MLFNSSDNEKLFAKSVPVSVKDVYTNQSRASKLFLTIEWQDASSGMFSKKVLAITLTDNNDPFFLYNLLLAEEDFQMLKASQDLLINFASFPQHIIDYVEMCLLEERNPQPKFLLMFTVHDKNPSINGNVTTNSQLDIIETNQFKHLTHLSLRFVAATDSAVRTYLASCFRSLKEERSLLQNKLVVLEQDLKDKLTACQHTLTSKSQELELLRKELNVELSMRESKHSVELQEERNRLLNKLREEEDRFERELKEKEQNLRRQIQQLESRVSCLDTLNKELQDKNYHHESTLRELRSNLLSSEEEVRKLKENVHNLKRKCENLNSELKEKQSQIHRREEKISNLEQELRSKEYSIGRLKEQIDADEKWKKTLETQLESTKLQLEMSENSRKVLEEDKAKSYDIIRKLQDKVKTGHEKAKSKSELSLKQEQELREKDELLQQLKAEKTELDFNLQAKNSEVKTLHDSVNSLKKKLEGLEKELRVKENTIKYLSRQLTEQCIFPQYTPPSNLGPSPSSCTQLQRVCFQDKKSASPENSPVPPVTPKSLRKPSRNSSSNLQRADSAYCTSPSDFTQSTTPTNPALQNAAAFNPEHFDVDPAALSAAFGSENQKIIHSTAKKQPIAAKTPKTSRVSKLR